MTPVGIVLDERFQRHLPGPGHPERPQRLQAIEAALAQAGLLERCARLEAQPIDTALAERVHTGEYLARLAAACARGEAFIDTPDSGICSESYQVARLAAGGVVEAARRVGSGDLERVFCAVRPPGHHAEADRSMGFCLLNNVVLAAHVLREEYALERILILDWDVHHGNGTQHLCQADPSVLYVSLHGHPDALYPGTGYESEVGVGAGKGYTLNVPLPPGSDDEVYQAALLERVSPVVARFGPQVILISAGFDAHTDDPLGCLRLSDAGFAWLTRTVRGWAGQYANDRVVSVLEGGYDLDVLRRCVAAHVAILGDG